MAKKNYALSSVFTKWIICSILRLRWIVLPVVFDNIMPPSIRETKTDANCSGLIFGSICLYLIPLLIIRIMVSIQVSMAFEARLF